MNRNLAPFFLACLFTPSAVATNPHFLPGDAFFSGTLPQVKIEEGTTAAESTFEFNYSRFDGQFFACGNIGYSKLAIEGITLEMRQALAEAYWRYASGNRPIYREEGNDGKSALEQTNSVVALIYNKTFDLGLPLGLKFNEAWSAQGAGHYAGLFETAPPVSVDWEHAAAVPPLAVREKLDPLLHLATSYEVAHTVDSPLHIGSEDIQIILVGFAQQQNTSIMQRCPSLQTILDGADSARYMVVTKGLIRDFSSNENGLWTETSIRIPLKENSWIPEKPTKPDMPHR